MPVALAAGATYGQLIGAILLLAGLLTPLGAGVIAGTMAVATTKLIERGGSFVNPAGLSWEASSFHLIGHEQTDDPVFLPHIPFAQQLDPNTMLCRQPLSVLAKPIPKRFREHKDTMPTPASYVDPYGSGYAGLG